jgi:DNA-binding NtrC family response regulator
MLASAVNSALQSVSFPTSKPRLLLVSDSYDRLKSLEAGINQNDFEITMVCSLEELTTACGDRHDLVALDVSSEQIAPMLKQIRTSATHMTVPVLVEATRLTNDISIAGLLPEYRAMPCSRMEMMALVQRGVEPDADDPARRHIL